LRDLVRRQRDDKKGINKNAILFNPATVNLDAYVKNSSDYSASMTAHIVDGEILYLRLLHLQVGLSWIRRVMFMQWLMPVSDMV
jgi:hypothetical protein